MIKIRDKWVVLDINASDLQIETVNSLRNFGIIYYDQSGLKEHLFSPASVLENKDAVNDIPFVKISAPQLKELVSLMEKHDAFYIRIIE